MTNKKGSTAITSSEADVIVSESPVESSSGLCEVVYSKEFNTTRIQVAKVKATSERGEVFIPSLWDEDGLVWMGGAVPSVKKATNMATIACNRYTGLFKEVGLASVDPDLLVRLPYNELIYLDNESNIQRLIDELDIEQPSLLSLVIDQWGIIIDGNSRHAAVERLNARDPENRKFRRIPVEIKSFPSGLARLEELRLRNSYRTKSRIQELNEMRLKLQIEIKKRQDALGKPKSQKPRGRSIERVAAETGISRNTLHRGLSAIEEIERIKDSNPSLAQKWTQLLNEGTNKMSFDIVGVPSEDREAVIDKLYEKGKLSKKVSVDKAHKAVLAEKLRNSDGAGATESSDRDPTGVDGETTDALTPDLEQANEQAEREKQARLNTYKELGDKPTDNWYTPTEIIELILEVMGEIDLDPFSDLQKRIPAKNHYTIFDDAFADKNHWTGSVFANILYSDPAKCLKKASKEILDGHTKKGLYLCESGVLFNKKTQTLIDKHEMSICNWKGRIDFIPGEFLLDESPNTVTGASRINSVILFYSLDPADHRQFEEVFSPFGKIYHDVGYYLHHSQSSLDPFDAVKVNWEDGKSKFGHIELSVYESEDTLWVAQAGEHKIDSLSDKKEAEVTAIALAISNYSSNDPFS